MQRIKELGVKAGVSLNPATSLESIREVLPELDLLLIMSVNPGFGGQKFIDSSLDKLRMARQIIDELDIALIYVGQLEERLHPDGVAKLEVMAEQGMLDVIYANDRVIIYAVEGELARNDEGVFQPS